MKNITFFGYASAAKTTSNFVGYQQNGSEITFLGYTEGFAYEAGPLKLVSPSRARILVSSSRTRAFVSPVAR
jgi:hypothetical protein